MGDISRQGIEAPPAMQVPRPLAKSVTHVPGLKCYLCTWTEPDVAGGATRDPLERRRSAAARPGVPPAVQKIPLQVVLSVNPGIVALHRPLAASAETVRSATPRARIGSCEPSDCGAELR